jgi:hypothetical protein
MQINEMDIISIADATDQDTLLTVRMSQGDFENICTNRGLTIEHRVGGHYHQVYGETLDGTHKMWYWCATGLALIRS